MEFDGIGRHCESTLLAAQAGEKPQNSAIRCPLTTLAWGSG
jgi:hypothetical protein